MTDAQLDAALTWLRKYLGPLDGVETIIAGVAELRAELARTTALMFDAQNDSIAASEAKFLIAAERDALAAEVAELKRLRASGPWYVDDSGYDG